MGSIAQALLVLLLWFLLVYPSTQAVQPKIYVYDLPQWKNFTQHGDISDSDYGLDQLFPELLKASAHVTDNAEEADYFFADAWIFWPHTMPNIHEILAAIRGKGPWFDRKNGSDHIFVITADQGRCQYEVKDMRNVILLQHYGGTLHGTDFFTQPDSLLKQWGGDFDRQLVMSEALRADPGEVCKTRMVRCTEDQHGRQVPFFCNIPFQDIVVPPPSLERPNPRECHHCQGFDDGHNIPLAFQSPYLDEDAAKLAASRSTLLFHAGSAHFHNAEYYSVGARQSMIKMFGHRRQEHLGFVLNEGGMGKDYWPQLLRSIFCLATTGTGWGSRLKVGLVRGCIPLVMMDGVKVEFEEQLPLMEYAVRIPSFMMYRTHEILQHLMASGRVAALQENLKCAWRLHTWRRPHGRAFEVVMCELRRRKLGLPKKSRIEIDFKACTMTCVPGDTPVSLISGGVSGL